MALYEEYAAYNGLDSDDARKVLLAGMDGGEIPNIDDGSHELKYVAEKLGIPVKMDITVSDTKAEALAKLKATRDTLASVFNQQNRPGAPYEVDLAGSIRDDLDLIINWMEGAYGDYYVG